MSKELEIENTFLLAKVPLKVIKEWKKDFTKDIYYPQDSDNPQIRLRQRGDRYMITKKYPLVKNDLSTMVEETIKLTKAEYSFFATNLAGKSVAKNRYSMDFDDYVIEIDEYLELLSPLIVLDIEWRRKRGSYASIIKEFNAVKEITNVSALAAGKMAGKTYDQIKNQF